MRAKRLLPLVTDSIFILLAVYLAIGYARSMFTIAESRFFLIHQTLFLMYLVIALALFSVRNRAIVSSSKITDYVYTLLALGSPLFLQPALHGGALIVGESLEFVGAALVLGSFYSLNRSFGVAPENRGVKTAGMYRIVRHPMYLGYILGITGFVFRNFSFFNLFILTISVITLLLRLQAEERFFREDPAYQSYARMTRWKLIPLVF